MLTPRQAQLAFVPVMVTAMSAIISFALTAIRHGMGPGLVHTWLVNWGWAFLVALPAAWMIVPAVRAGLARITRSPPVSGR